MSRKRRELLLIVEVLKLREAFEKANPDASWESFWAQANLAGKVLAVEHGVQVAFPKQTTVGVKA